MDDKPSRPPQPALEAKDVQGHYVGSSGCVTNRVRAGVFRSPAVAGSLSSI